MVTAVYGIRNSGKMNGLNGFGPTGILFAPKQVVQAVFDKGTSLKIGPTQIEDTFAEAFSMSYTRLVVTAMDPFWLDNASNEFSGYGTSVIACDAEVGVEQTLDSASTMDGRSGLRFMAFGFSPDAVQKAMLKRVGQCLMTCPTTAVFDGQPECKEKIDLGKSLRYFGDGFQKSKLIGERRFWRIPVMDGEFVVEESIGVAKGIGGGNFLIQSVDQQTGLAAARRAIETISQQPNVITPFPGGVARSGSKVGSRYANLLASTSDAYCPTLRARVESKIFPDANCVYEIVIDGSTFEDIALAMKNGITSAIGDGVVAISAANFGGNLGKHHFGLQELLS